MKKLLPLFIFLNGAIFLAAQPTSPAIAQWISITDSSLHGFHVQAVAADTDGQSIFVAGSFDSVVYFVKYKEADKWINVGEPLNGNVSVMDIIGEELYIGGAFRGTSAFPESLQHIARLKISGNEWEQAGAGLDNNVWAFCRVGRDSLFVGGSFQRSLDGTQLNGLALWNGRSFNPLGRADAPGVEISDSISGVHSLCLIGSDLYFGGGFVRDKTGSALNRIARWQSKTNSFFPEREGFGDGSVDALAFNGSYLIAGGSFEHFANGTLAGHLAKWDGQRWLRLGNFDQNVCTVLAADSRLFAGGSFTRESSKPLKHIACFDFRHPDKGWNPPTADDAGFVGITTQISVSGLSKQKNGLLAWGNFDASQKASGLDGIAFLQHTMCVTCLFCDFTPPFTEVHHPDEAASCKALVVIPPVMEAPFGLQVTDFVRIGTGQPNSINLAGIPLMGLTNDSLLLENLTPGQSYWLRAYAGCTLPPSTTRYFSEPSRPVAFGARMVEAINIKKTSAEIVIGLQGTSNPLKVSVYYRQLGATDWQQLMEPALHSMLHFKITGLKPATVYEYKAGYTSLRSVQDVDTPLEVVEECIYLFKTN